MNDGERKTGGLISWPLLIATSSTRDEFIAFWDRHYSGYDEDVYQRNIGQPLTDKRIAELFVWKNSMRLAGGKAKSVARYSSPQERIPANADNATAQAFLSRPGGAIWRIFWAHLQHPNEYPIYDQHAHRAMAFLRGWPNIEIPDGPSAQVRMYLDEYRLFFQQFKGLPHRSVDRALWSFGKFISLGYGCMLR